jgi:nucleoside-diphosphate-sugar epimerase
VKVLVTGAGGFLGRHVVARLLERGHAVRVVLRPSSPLPAWGGEVEVVRGDLRSSAGLAGAFHGVDLAMHLAVGAHGDDEVLLADTLLGTERFLEAMARSPVKRLVLASSFVVYDWGRARGTLDEQSPLVADVYGGSGYDIAKHWQERMVSTAAKDHEWEVTVLRPGFIWGAGRAAIAGMGRRLGSCYLLIGPWTRLPLTHVENCADCFVASVENAAAIGQVFNVIDDDAVRVWRYAREYARGTGQAGIPVPIPYLAGLGLARLAALTSRLLFGKKGRLPSLLTPRRFVAQFKPLRFSNRNLRHGLGWSPPLSFEECLARTYGPRRATKE